MEIMLKTGKTKIGKRRKTTKENTRSYQLKEENVKIVYLDIFELSNRDERKAEEI